jgi:FixJ family two-component response regulator
MKQVHVVDDDEAVRDALTYLLVGEGFTVTSYESAEAFIEAGKPSDGVVVLDVRMTGMSGIELFHELLKTPPVPPVVFLTGHGDVPLAVEAMKSGALDFHEKPFDETRFLATVRRGLETWEREKPRQQSRAKLDERMGMLSERERQVMEQMVAGQANKQIAHALGITVRTVEVHRANVLRKLGYRSVVNLLRDLQ